ncbi:uncharacterized protein LOC128669070 [Microplitis demolitor]|uniref:uncharacterized protein LOC128668990 n=1 Tax=Microplitis demolitor TaxID=69319 RepID=UPI00235B6AB1|nr:uncharacterized protein LOC128668990 [Microplitis demolitor]XP_053599229.1 uncharacterized protein LOC128669070 [Microplitis demolitor]
MYIDTGIMSNNIFLFAFFALVGLTRIEAMPTKGSEGTWDVDYEDQEHTGITCRENEHYNSTRIECEDECNDRNNKLCYRFQQFCWCNEGYIRNSSHICVKLEDCLKDEEQKSETLASSANNDSSKRLEDDLKLFSHDSVSHTSLEPETQAQKFNGIIDQETLDLVFGKPENSSADNKPLETKTQAQKFNGIINEETLDLVFGKPENSWAENKPLETKTQAQKFNGIINEETLDLVFGKPENSWAENKPLETETQAQKFNGIINEETLDLVFGKPENSWAENKPLETKTQAQKFNGIINEETLDLVFGKPENSWAENKPLETKTQAQKFNGIIDQYTRSIVFVF